MRFLILIILSLPLITWAHSPNKPGFYFGTNLGWGKTDWSFMVAQPNSQAATETTIGAKDTSLAGGFFVGYQFTPRFALEAAWNHFGTTVATLSPFSVYLNSNNLDPVNFNSRTWSTNLITRYFVFLNNSKTFSIVPEVGLNYTHRKDFIASVGTLGALFGLGVSYTLGEHVVTGLRFQYTTGIGKDNDLPLYNYVPFTQAVFATVAYKL